MAPGERKLTLAFWMGLAGLSVVLGALSADCDDGTAVTLVRFDELNGSGPASGVMSPAFHSA